MIKVTVLQYEREMGRLQGALSTDLSTGSVDKETPGSELEFDRTTPTQCSHGGTTCKPAKVCDHTA